MRFVKLFLLTSFLLCPIDGHGSQAIVPIVAYNPTYKLIVGGAYFSFPGDSRGNGSSFGLQVLSTFTNNVKLIPEYKLVWNSLRFELNGKWSTYYDPYYGEGSETEVEDEIQLDEESGTWTGGLFWQINSVWSIGPIYDLRYRQNRGIDGDPSLGAIEAERSSGYGLRITMDRRDTAFSTHSGNYVSLQGLNIPVSATTTEKGFQLLSADIRQFMTASVFTLALRVTGGVASQDTSYLYRYRLGGTDQLRGFYTNRFRGDNFVLGQAELRLELLSALSLVAFADAGNVGDPRITTTQQTYGGGLRFGLPPDWIKKARLDFAFAKDQSGVSFVFDETF